VQAASAAGRKVMADQLDVRNANACAEAVGASPIVAADRRPGQQRGHHPRQSARGARRRRRPIGARYERRRRFQHGARRRAAHDRAAAGKIINLSSVSGEKGGRGQTNYAASKGAINAFTRALAVELAPRKVTVNAVAPGVIETEMSQDVRELAGDQVLSKILLRRFGKPEDVAFAVWFLASVYADYVTGEILHVDGGFKME
jgi:NAD(P)-dependent dehydrogenase (short-subunit alcohol dehydrogenase family)